MFQKPFPDLRSTARRLADHTKRVARFIEGLPRRVDKLVDATRARDWSEVRRLSEFLACSSDIFGCTEVAQAAQRVCQEVDTADNDVAVKRSVIRLVGSCGALPDQLAADSVSTIDVRPVEAVTLPATAALPSMPDSPTGHEPMPATEAAQRVLSQRPASNGVRRARRARGTARRSIS